MINNYKDLTLEKYLALREIDLEQEEIDIQSEMLAILNDCTVDEILSLKLTEYHNLVNEMSFLLEEPKPLKKVPNEIKIGDKKYTVLRSARDMTAGQFIDYQTYIKDINTAEKNLPLLMTCFCIPKGKKYGEYDFVELASEYSEDEVITFSFGKGEMDPVFEKAAFQLETDEVSEVLETDKGYHILKCINTFNREETDVNKIQIVEQRRNEAFGEEYDVFVDSLVRQLNQKLWDRITLIHDPEVTTSDFFSVFDNYFPESK